MKNAEWGTLIQSVKAIESYYSFNSKWTFETFCIPHSSFSILPSSFRLSEVAAVGLVLRPALDRFFELIDCHIELAFF